MTMETITHSIDASGKARGVDHDPDPEIPAKARRRQFSARYKAEVLAAYDQLPRSERGSFLRREGLYSSNITEWRHQRDRGALEALAKPLGRPPADARDREVLALRKENERLARELDKAHKVIEVQGHRSQSTDRSLALKLVMDAHYALSAKFESSGMLYEPVTLTP